MFCLWSSKVYCKRLRNSSVGISTGVSTAEKIHFTSHRYKLAAKTISLLILIIPRKTVMRENYFGRQTYLFQKGHNLPEMPAFLDNSASKSFVYYRHAMRVEMYSSWYARIAGLSGLPIPCQEKLAFSTVRGQSKMSNYSPPKTEKRKKELQRKKRFLGRWMRPENF